MEEEEEDSNEHASNHRSRKVIHINARGNLCDKLPYLVQTRRQFFQEMWSEIYTETCHLRQ
jgi:hypothetical protein